MLVITRKPGQTIRVGDAVEIVIIEVRGDQVRLGIRAPRETPIRRGEIPDFTTDEVEGTAEQDVDTLPSGNETAGEGIGLY